MGEALFQKPVRQVVGHKGVFHPAEVNKAPDLLLPGIGEIRLRYLQPYLSPAQQLQVYRAGIAGKSGAPGEIRPHRLILQGIELRSLGIILTGEKAVTALGQRAQVQRPVPRLLHQLQRVIQRRVHGDGLVGMLV